MCKNNILGIVNVNLLDQEKCPYVRGVHKRGYYFHICVSLSQQYKHLDFCNEVRSKCCGE